ncbi:MAG: response regulator transcription factor [Bacteroidetes bacterium]|nr:response regulator transcription factor [Bacteroidota bacterium]
MDKVKKKILLADDDPDQIFQVSHHLKKWGYDVVAVESREEAERYLESECPDLAILDLMMEEEDSGFILAYRIKQCCSEVPVIIATAVTAERGISFDINSPEYKAWIKADHYLEKGYRMEELEIIIKGLLK